MAKLPRLGAIGGTTRLFAALALAAMLVALVVGLLSWWSMGLDNDFWYHLNAGRYIVSQHEIPDHEFYSFLEPPRPYVAYCWLFQCLAYACFQLLGIYGLVLLRAAAFLGMIALAFTLLEHRRVELAAEDRRGFPVLPSLIAVFYVLALIARFASVRPHMLTLLLLTLCLYILECRPRRLWLLAPVTLLWMNLHGIMYPIMLLVLGSYLAELVLRTLAGRRPWTRQETVRAAWIVGAMTMLLATPQGFRLIGMPFESTGVAAQYILELRRVDPLSLLDWSVGSGGIAPQTALNLIRALIAVALVWSVARRRLRVSHALLVAGGVGLMIKGARFEYELALLGLPLVATAAAQWETRAKPGRVAVVAAGLVALIGAFSVAAYFRQQRELIRPYGAHGAPRGVARFLEQEGVGGRVLHHPNLGGYLEWKLYPRFETTADMQTPFVFSNTDIFQSVKVFNDELLLRRMLAQYGPDYIVAPLGNFGFSGYITGRAPYVPVFIDDMNALYANRQSRSEVARRFAIRNLRLTANLIGQMAVLEQSGEVEGALEDIERMLRIDPEGGLLNLLAAKLQLRSGRIDAAQRHAALALESLGGSEHAHAVAGDVLGARQRWREAAREYRRGVARATEETRRGLYRKLGRSLSRAGRDGRAYAAMREAIDVLSADTTREDLYELALSARRAGKEAEARDYLEFAYLQTPPSDTAWRRRIEAALRE